MLLDLYGHIIKKTYEKRLATIIKKDQIEGSYSHYIQLYDLVIEKEKQRIDNNQQIK